MAVVVNLRRFRKARARSDRNEVAARNRSRFGRGAAEILAIADDRARREARLDGHRLDTTEAVEPFAAAKADEEPGG